MGWSSLLTFYKKNKTYNLLQRLSKIFCSTVVNTIHLWNTGKWVLRKEEGIWPPELQQTLIIVSWEIQTPVESCPAAQVCSFKDGRQRESLCFSKSQMNLSIKLQSSEIHMFLNFPLLRHWVSLLMQLFSISLSVH